MEAKPTHRVDLVRVLEAAPLRIRYLEGQGDEMVLAFSGVGNSTDPDVEPEIEFYRTASNGGARHVLFVTDQSRCWLNGPNMAELIADCALSTMARVGARRLTALGNSMGGTMALLMARFLPLQAVLAIAPQYSVDLALMREEPNWLKLRKKIGVFRFPAVDFLPPHGQYFVLHGTKDTEYLHAARFAPAANLHHFILPGHDHNLSVALKAMGQTQELVTLALSAMVAEFAQAVTAIGAIPRLVYQPAGVSA